MGNDSDSDACPGFVDEPGLHQECGCFELATAFELPAPEDDCPATESRADAHARRKGATAAAEARRRAALADLNRTIARAEQRYEEIALGEQRLARKIAVTRSGLSTGS